MFPFFYKPLKTSPAMYYLSTHTLSLFFTIIFIDCSLLFIVKAGGFDLVVLVAYY